MAIKEEFLPDLSLSSDANRALIEHLSAGWSDYKIVSLIRINEDDKGHQSGWVVEHEKQDNG